MSEYIEREKLNELLHRKAQEGDNDDDDISDDYLNGWQKGLSMVMQLIDDISAADVRPEIHSQWMICSDGYYPYCKMCGQEPQGREMSDYCPNCGAKMDGEVGSVDE